VDIDNGGRRLVTQLRAENRLARGSDRSFVPAAGESLVLAGGQERGVGRGRDNDQSPVLPRLVPVLEHVARHATSLSRSGVADIGAPP
jgi:hypothetical protein